MIEKMRLEPHGIEPGDAANQLKKLLPAAVRDGKIDFDLLRELLGDELLDDDEKAEPWGLNWPGKRDARKMAMTPSRLTLKPLPGEGTNEDNAQHVLIEGDNLEVLKVLRKSYFGQVKMIYIDPPYNTGNDFIYKETEVVLFIGTLDLRM